MLADGHTYERAAIVQWFAASDGRYTSPKTNSPVDPNVMLPNYALRTAIQEYIKTVPVTERPEAPAADRPEPMPARSESGVEVAEAGDAQVNGWYVRKWAANGPPAVWSDLSESMHPWAQSNSGRYWYEKDDGCFIYHDGQSWDIIAPDGFHLYYMRCGVSIFVHCIRIDIDGKRTLPVMTRPQRCVQ